LQHQLGAGAGPEIFNVNLDDLPGCNVKAKAFFKVN
jgi:hypothetical protein